MLLAEYDYETDIAVQRAEEREIAFAEGIEQGTTNRPLLITAKGISKISFSLENGYTDSKNR